jgi:hypothetical protein
MGFQASAETSKAAPIRRKQLFENWLKSTLILREVNGFHNSMLPEKILGALLKN